MRSATMSRAGWNFLQLSSIKWTHVEIEGKIVKNKSLKFSVENVDTLMVTAVEVDPGTRIQHSSI